MQMSNSINQLIEKLFDETTVKVHSIIKNSSNSDIATKRIVEYVSPAIAAATSGYIALLYSNLSKQTLSEELFSSSKNANRFYALDLRDRIVEAYSFDINQVKSFQDGIQFTEINRTYTAVIAAVGTAGITGALLGILVGTVNLPVAVVIAGALVAGVAASGVTYYKITPELNKKKYLVEVDRFLLKLKKSIIAWIEAIEQYYNDEVDKLKNELRGETDEL